MDQQPQRRKLAIAAGGVAAFVGFVALTSWTSSGQEDGQNDADMAAFCYVVSSTESYATVLQIASASGGFDTGGGGGVDIEGETARFLADALVERAPDKYLNQADHAVEGINRAIEGDLDPFEADRYIAGFEQLERDSSEDCAPFAGQEGDIGLIPSPSPGDEGEGEGGGGFGGGG